MLYCLWHQPFVYVQANLLSRNQPIHYFSKWLCRAALFKYFGCIAFVGILKIYCANKLFAVHPCSCNKCHISKGVLSRKCQNWCWNFFWPKKLLDFFTQGRPSNQLKALTSCCVSRKGAPIRKFRYLHHHLNDEY